MCVALPFNLTRIQCTITLVRRFTVVVPMTITKALRMLNVRIFRYERPSHREYWFSMLIQVLPGSLPQHC